MMGRAAYQEPWRLLAVDPLLFGEPAPFASAKDAAAALIPYIERELARGARLHAITRHVLGLFRGVPGRARLPPPSGDRGGQARRRRRTSWLMRLRWWWTRQADLAHIAGLTVFCRRPGSIMLLGYPLGELAWLARLIAGAGVVAGILAGLFGIGGGAIIVPVLYEVFRVLGVPEDVRMQLCVGTSLAIIVPTTVRSYLAHKQQGAVIDGRGAGSGRCRRSSASRSAR